ncbi:MAG: PAS domain-containing protein [Ferruginibacter sp.]
MFGKRSAKKTEPAAVQLEYLQTIIDNSLDVIQVFEAVRDDKREIIDFTWLTNNKKGVEQNGDVTGKRVLQQNPGMVVSGIFDRMRLVVETGVPFDEEQYYSFEQFSGNWYYLTLVKFGDGVIMTTKDITRYKKAEQELLQANKKLAEQVVGKYEMLFNSIDEGFCIIEVMFDKNGDAYDYRFLEANPSFVKQTGLVNAVGKTIKELVPGLEQYWLDIYGRIAKTGKAERFENNSSAIGRYYDVYAFKVNGAGEYHVAVIFNDISERRKNLFPVSASETEADDNQNSYS